MFKLKNNPLLFLLLITLFLFSFFPVIKVYIGPLYFLIPVIVFGLYFFFNNDSQSKIILDSELNLIYFLFFIWISYSLISYIWAAEKDIVLEYSLWIFSYFVIFFIFSQKIRKFIDYQFIFNILLFILFIYLIIALWEMLSFQHLPLSRMARNERISFIPTGPFYNENSFAAALILLFPFLLYSTKILNNKIYDFLQPLLIIIIIIIAIIQKARLAILAVAFNVILYFIFSLNFRSKVKSISLIILLIVLFGAIYPQEMELIFSYLVDQIESLQTEQVQLLPSSMKIRVTLLHHSLDIAYESFFLGIGSGNFINRMNSWRKSETFNTLDPHNYVMELLVNFGLLITLLFVIFIISVSYRLFNKVLKAQGSIKWFYAASLLSIINFWAASLLPGSIRKLFFFWLIFAYCYSLAKSENGLSSK